MYKYYIDKGHKPHAGTVFVVDTDSGDSCNDGMLMSYCPIGQHSEDSIDYIKSCKEISKDEYIKYSNGLYTPEDYLA